MKKILFALLVFAVCFAAAACTTVPSTEPVDTQSQSAQPTPTESQNAAQRDIVDLKNKMLEKFNVTDSVEFSADLLLNMYGITASDVEEVSGYMTLDGVFPQEVIMIKATSESGKQAVISALNKRIDEVKVQSQNYDAENYALAQKCKVESDGLYVTMFLSPNVEEMTNMFYSN